MRFLPTPIDGVVVVELEPRTDERGWFARAFCAGEFAEHGLENHIEQINISTSGRAGTLRGLHYQLSPAAESKLMRCVRGAMFDVAVDLRPDSPTYGEWFGVELRADNGSALVVPPGCAHGFQTLVNDTVALYPASAAHRPELERGLNHADPDVGIRWPRDVTCISERDRSLPLLREARVS